MRTETDTSQSATGSRSLIAAFMLVAGAWPVHSATNSEPVSAVTNRTPVASTNAPASKASRAEVPTARDFTSFKLINDRNIFNPNRSRRAGPGDREGARPKVTEYFALAGTMSSAKGDVAFFDGSSASYKKVLKPGDKIAGHKIAEVTPHAVQLEKDGNTVELAVGAQMKRLDDESWKPTVSTLVLASDVKPAPESKTESTDAGDDVLKRLLQKREEEINK